VRRKRTLVAFAGMESRLIQVRDATLHVGGPGCVQYLERDEISPPGHRAWYPEPRGVGRSGGGPTPCKKQSLILRASVRRWVLIPGSSLATRGAASWASATRSNRVRDNHSPAVPERSRRIRDSADPRPCSRGLPRPRCAIGSWSSRPNPSWPIRSVLCLTTPSGMETEGSALR
jgi:hypothetical protein